jgi:hypothetical protein
LRFVGVLAHFFGGGFTAHILGGRETLDSRAAVTNFFAAADESSGFNTIATVLQSTSGIVWVLGDITANGTGVFESV